MVIDPCRAFSDKAVCHLADGLFCFPFIMLSYLIADKFRNIKSGIANTGNGAIFMCRNMFQCFNAKV